MKKVIFVAMCAIMLFGTVAIGYAEHGDWRGGIRERVHQAKERIERGVENGTLTRHDAKRLHEELDGIMGKIDRMKSDGDFGPREREQIHRDLNRLERDIAREKRGR